MPRRLEIALCGSRKYPYSPHGRLLEILKGKMVLKAQIFRGMYEAKLKFSEGWGWGGSNQKKKPTVEGV